MKREDLLDLNEALQHPGKRQIFPIRTELANEEDLDLLAPVEGSLEAISTGNLLLIKADLTTRVVLECARCGSPLEQDLAFRMEEEFQVEGVPSSYARDGHAKVVADEPEPLFQNNWLIRDTFIRQGLLLSMPLQPLCSGAWDVPCPESPETTLGAPKDSGHPVFQNLAQLRLPEES